MPDEINKPLLIGCGTIVFILLFILFLIGCGVIYVLIDLLGAVNDTYKHGW